jgi:hypothetical protein
MRTPLIAILLSIQQIFQILMYLWTVIQHHKVFGMLSMWNKQAI